MTVRKTLMMGFILLLRVTRLAATDGDEGSVARINVRIWDRVPIDAKTLDGAKAITEKIFGRVGVEIFWQHCTPEPTAENMVCASPAGTNDIGLRIFRASKSDRRAFRHSTGGAAFPEPNRPGSGIIHLFYDRMEKIVEDSGGMVSLKVTIGITLAHEMGHLLVSTKHSHVGLMQAKLRAEDWQLACQGQLTFNDQESEFLRRTVWLWNRRR